MAKRTLQTKEQQMRSETLIADVLPMFRRARWDIEERTKNGYEASIRRFMKYHDTISELNLDAADDYIATVADHPAMARNEAIALRQVAAFATSRGVVQCASVEQLRLPKAPGKRRKPFVQAEVDAIIKTASTSKVGIRDRAIVMLGISAAVRPGEMWAVKLSDLDIENGWITVRRETTKTAAGERSVPLDPQVIAVLEEYISEFRGRKEGPLFLNAHGDPLTQYGFMAIFYRLRDRLREQGIDGYQAYRQRHTGITNWGRAGVPTPIVQQLAGHKSITTTEGYIGKMDRADLSRGAGIFTKTYGRVAS